MVRRVVRVTLEVEGPAEDPRAVAGAPWQEALPDAHAIQVLEAVRAPSGRCVMVIGDGLQRFHIPVGPFATRDDAAHWAEGERVHGEVMRLWEPVDFADYVALRAIEGHLPVLCTVCPATIVPPTALLQFAGLAPGCVIGVMGADLYTDALIGPFIDQPSFAVYAGEVIGRTTTVHDVIVYPVYRPQDYHTAAHILAGKV